jgi:4-hydroxy-4-methyl-2-oxoglutarate aldolase
MALTKEQLLEFLKLPTGNVGDANGKKGCMSPNIKPVDPKCHLAGKAVTVECYPGDNLALHQGIYAAQPGDVLVYNIHGYNGAGHFGDIMATACQARGIAGVVMDGSCRDSEDMKEMGFPIFATAYNPSGTVKESLAKINVPIVCGGVLVNPGDIIVGDCDGVVVIPADKAEEVLQKAQGIFNKEIEVRKQLLAGKTTLEIYGFDKIIASKQ